MLKRLNRDLKIIEDFVYGDALTFVCSYYMARPIPLDIFHLISSKVLILTDNRTWWSSL